MMQALTTWLQDAVKAVLPGPAVEKIRGWRHDASVRRFHAGVRQGLHDELQRMLRGWRTEVGACAPHLAAAHKHGRILVFPADLRSIAGSLGDEAMLAAVRKAFSAVGAAVEIDLFCEAEGAEQARGLGFHPIPIGDAADFPAAVAALLRQGRHDAYVGVGADVVDGCYGPKPAAMMLIAADLAARHGMQAVILGCSFSRRAAPELKPVFRRLDPRVALNMRDAVSYERVQRFARVRPRLVADAAFTLQPGQADGAAVAWMRQQRAEGRMIVGVNAHPLLAQDEAGMDRLLAGLADALCQVAQRRAVSWLLLPHDRRERYGDVACLERVHHALQARSGAAVHLVRGAQSAADLKALAGHLDGVISGRMHLAIAALGMGVPCLGITYQDKFEGLYRHFELPPSLLVPPAVVERGTDMARHIEGFIDALPNLAGVIERQRPHVMQLAQRNFQ